MPAARKKKAGVEKGAEAFKKQQQSIPEAANKKKTASRLEVFLEYFQSFDMPSLGRRPVVVLFFLAFLQLELIFRLHFGVAVFSSNLVGTFGRCKDFLENLNYIVKQ